MDRPRAERLPGLISMLRSSKEDRVEEGASWLPGQDPTPDRLCRLCLMLCGYAFKHD